MSVELRSRRVEVLQHRLGGVEGLVLLGVVPDLQPVARLDPPGVGRIDARQDPQQSGLAGAVEPEDHHPAALVHGEVDVGEDLQGPVALGELGRRQGGLPARRRLRELDACDPVGPALALDALHQLLRALEHRLGGLGLGRLGAHLVGLVGERLGLVLGVEPLALAALLVGLALGEVGLPADVVDVDRRPVGVEVQHPVDAGLQQPDVVGDHHEPALVGAQELAEPDDGVRVEVVRRLVQEQGLGAGEQDPGQLDTTALPTGEGPQRLGEEPVGDAERGGDLSRLGLGGVPAGGVQRGVGPLVARHRPVPDERVVAAHLGLGVPQPAYDRVEAAGREDPVAREHLEVTGARVLRQVADGAVVGHRAAGRERLTGQDPGQVVLPAPLRPTRPTRSPAPIRNETSPISRRAPARTSSSETVINVELSRIGEGTPPGRVHGGPVMTSLRAHAGRKGRACGSTRGPGSTRARSRRAAGAARAGRGSRSRCRVVAVAGSASARSW